MEVGMAKVLLFLVTLGITIYAVIDAIQTEDTRVQHLPKLVWIVLILLFSPPAAIAWYFVGRQRGPLNTRRGPNYPSAPRGPDDDPEFLRGL
jgi:Phospholipase_D-nuclease N-terminal